MSSGGGKLKSSRKKHLLSNKLPNYSLFIKRQIGISGVIFDLDEMESFVDYPQKKI